VKRFVSLQFLNPKTVGSTPRVENQPVARPLPIQTQNKHRQTNIYALSGIRTHDPSVRAGKIVHALDLAAIVIGSSLVSLSKLE
jgi:hypothetical protein